MGVGKQRSVISFWSKEKKVSPVDLTNAGVSKVVEQYYAPCFFCAFRVPKSDEIFCLTQPYFSTITQNSGEKMLC